MRPARGLARAAALVVGLAAVAASGDELRVDDLSSEAPLPWEERAIGTPLDADDLASLSPEARLEALVTRGEHLFSAKFTTLDGAGRPMATQAIVPTKRRRPIRQAFSRTSGPDANACSSCHNDPMRGGAGDFAVNVFVSEGFESADFDSLDPQFSNERGTNHLFGAGLVELLAREMTRDLEAVRADALRRARETGTEVVAPLETKGVAFGSITAHPDGLVDLGGVRGVDDDLVVRPFSHKGVMTSLRQFSVNALNHHHGIQATERFGTRWTGEDDFDGDGILDEMADGDVAALVAWQATLGPPSRKADLSEPWQEASARGKDGFETFGCVSCHRPTLPLDSLVFRDPGPVEAAGTLRETDVAQPLAYDLALTEWAETLERDDQGRYLVPLFGDLKRHVVTDKQIDAFGNELLAQRFVERAEFMTSELWGVGSTAPYGHRGDMTTLDEVIRAHGGEARAARDAYVAADETLRTDLIAYLKTLVIEE